MKALLSEKIGSILILTLNRPQAANALNFDLVGELAQAIQGVKDDTRVVIISGGPGRFCAGLDLKLATSLDPARRLEFVDRVKDCFMAVLTCPRPVIAEIDGPALAGGFDLAVVCDFRCASTRSSFGQPEVNLGLSQLIDPLWRIIGLGPARELAMTGRIYGADGAQSLGLLTRVAEPMELRARTLELARELAAKEPQGLAQTKELFRTVPGLDQDQAIARQVKTFKESITRPGAMEGVRAYLRRVGIDPDKPAEPDKKLH